MVLKHMDGAKFQEFLFYSSVILNGTETGHFGVGVLDTFYSSVILNGTETPRSALRHINAFYSSVILNGTET